jgi:hypothetical protein
VSGVADQVFYVTDEQGVTKMGGKTFGSKADAIVAAHDESWFMAGAPAIVEKFDPATGGGIAVAKVQAIVTI